MSELLLGSLANYLHTVKLGFVPQPTYNPSKFYYADFCQCLRRESQAK